MTKRRPPRLDVECTHSEGVRWDYEPECMRCGRVGRIYPCGLGRSQMIWHHRGSVPTLGDIMVGVVRRELGQLSAVER